MNFRRPIICDQLHQERRAMRTHSLLMHCAYAAVTSLVLLGLGTAATPQELPAYMAPIAGRTVSSPADTATKNVLALNTYV